MKANELVLLDLDTLSHANDLSVNCLFPFAEATRGFAQTTPAETIAHIGNADAVICNKVPITAAVMDACPKLRYIGLLATGYNNVDLEAADAHGITVCNAGSYSTAAVTQLVFAYLFDYTQSIAHYVLDVQLGKWESSPTFSYFPYPTMELTGKTLSVIGYGKIGQSVANAAQAFGMRVLVATRTLPPACPFPLVSIAEAFARADVLTLHCPLTAQTTGLVCRENLQRMKPTAILINTARGGVVVEQDLADALNEDRLAAAYLDVLTQEPMCHDTPLRTAKHCAITPHIGWTPLETRKRLLDITVDNLRRFLAGTPQNVVNHPVKP